jgi:oxygen-dependent protoporphyrinogen oxidase
MSVVVVGGGLGGLAVAHRLLRDDPSRDVTLLEASDRLGGLVTTECTGGFVIERGPESMITTKPAGLALANELGLGPRLLRTRSGASGAYVVTRGRLERIPDGFSILAPTDFAALLRSPILSPAGKLRALADRVIPAHVREDDSLASFVRRRYGAEVLERLAQPLAAGIYGADPEVLSLRATMPRFLDAEQPGGVTRTLAQAAQASGEVSSGARYGLFVSLPRGMQELTDTLAAQVAPRVRLGARVTSLVPDAGGYAVTWEQDGRTESTRAAHVVLALPSPQVARLVSPFAPALATELGALALGSAAAVTMAFRQSDLPRPLDAYGFVVPAVERRMRDGLHLLERQVGRPRAGRRRAAARVLRREQPAHHPPGVRRPPARRIARAALRELVGIHASPGLVRVDRYVNAMPRYHVGHLQRVARIEACVAALPGLGLVGGAYRGVSLVGGAYRWGGHAGRGGVG